MRSISIALLFLINVALAYSSTFEKCQTAMRATILSDATRANFPSKHTDELCRCSMEAYQGQKTPDHKASIKKKCGATFHMSLVMFDIEKGLFDKCKSSFTTITDFIKLEDLQKKDALVSKGALKAASCIGKVYEGIF
jgi:hypothetical protein